MARGRPRGFDETEVLEQAMNLFWLHGYNGVGLRDLLAEMGISRQSLYGTFGSKRGLFLRVIEHYKTTRLAQALALLERPKPPLENVKAVMRFFESLATDERCRGCLVANAMVEVGPHDPEIASQLSEILETLQLGIRRSLEAAHDQGDLAGSKSPMALSRALTNAMVGLVVMGRLDSGATEVREIFSGTLSMLD